MKKFTFLMALVLGFALNAMALNPYAYGVSVTNDGNGNATVNYSLNAAATSAAVVFYNGETEASEVALTDLTAGAHSATVALPTAAGTYTVKIRVNGTSVAGYASATEYGTYGLDHPQGVAVDVDPASPYFGRILTIECLQSEGAWTLSGGKAGLYALNPDFTPVNASAPYTGGNTFSAKQFGLTATAYSPRKVRITEDGRIFLSSGANDKAILWEVDPANLNNWTEVIKGNLIDTAHLVQKYVNGTDTIILGYANLGMDVKGKGAELKVLMLGGDSAGLIGFAQPGYHMLEYPIGTAATYTTAPTTISKLDKKYWLGTSMNVCYDNRGGIWVCQYRGSTTATAPGLVHLNANDSVDFYGYGTSYDNLRAAAIKYLNDSVIAISSAAKKITFYKETLNADGSPVLTALGTVTCTSVGNNVNDIAFDYADNMYAVGNSSEKIGAYALPYSGIVETPVAGYSYKVVGPITEDLYLEFAANDTTVDNSNAYTATSAIATVFSQGAAYVAAIDSTDKVFSGRNSLPDAAGVKFGSSSAAGYLSLSLNGTIDAKAIVVISAGYGDTEYGNFTVNGTEISHTAAKALNKVWQFDTIAVNGVLSKIDIHQLTAKKGRFYLKGIKVIYNAPAPEPTSEIIWSDFLGDGAGAGAYSNKYKYGHKADQTVVNVVNIQKPGFAFENGIYLTCPADVTSCSLTGYDIQGAGILVYLSNFDNQQQTEFTITCGNDVYTCYIWNENPVATSLDEIQNEQAVKFFQNGQIYIRKGDAVYTVSGLRIE